MKETTVFDMTDKTRSGKICVVGSIVLVMIFIGCSDEQTVAVENEEPEQEVITDSDMMTSVLDDVDVKLADCSAVDTAGPSDLLFHVPLTEALQGLCEPLLPLTAPDGHQMVGQEWIQASGVVDISCTLTSTLYEFVFQGLVPNGVYTIWHFLPTGSGALASRPGRARNVFTADATGTADFSVTGTGGTMTFGGSAKLCTLPVPTKALVGNPVGAFFIVVYHLDNRTWGDISGPENTVAGHLAFLAR